MLSIILPLILYQGLFDELKISSTLLQDAQEPDSGDEEDPNWEPEPLHIISGAGMISYVIILIEPQNLVFGQEV